MKVYPQVEIIKVSKSEIYPTHDVEIEMQWVGDDGSIVRRKRIHELMEGDVVSWKNFTKEHDVD